MKKALTTDRDVDLLTIDDLKKHRPDLVESIRKKSRVENIDEAAKGAKNRCAMCGALKPAAKESAPLPGWTKVREAGAYVSQAKRNINPVKANLVEAFQALGLSEAESKIAAGLEE
jgi:hypothetical protein